MCPGFFKRLISLIILAFLCVAVSQVCASYKDVDPGSEFRGRWYLDMELNDDEIYTVEFDSGSQLSGFGAGIISRSNKINAIHQMDNGNYVLSSYSSMNVGGVKYESGDLFEYDPVTGQSSLFFSGSLFDKKENIDAVYVRSNSNIVFSTKGDAKLANVSFKKGDIVEYNPATDQLHILMYGESFDKNGNVEAAHILDDGDILFSISGASKLDNMKVKKGDLFRFDIQTSSISLAANLDGVIHGKDIEGFTAQIPDPASIMYLIAGALGLFGNRRKTT